MANSRPSVLTLTVVQGRHLGPETRVYVALCVRGVRVVIRRGQRRAPAGHPPPLGVLAAALDHGGVVLVQVVGVVVAGLGDLLVVVAVGGAELVHDGRRGIAADAAAAAARGRVLAAVVGEVVVVGVCGVLKGD